MTDLIAPEYSASNSLAALDTPVFQDGAKTQTSAAGALPRGSARTPGPGEAELQGAARSTTPGDASSRGIRAAKAADFSIPSSFARGDPPDCTCIISLVHLQELELQVATDGGPPDVLSGHLAAARWSEINLVPATLRRALSTAGVIDAETLIDRTALIRIGAKWNPAVRVLVRGALDDDAFAKVWSTCEAVLSSLTQNAQDRRNLKIDNLDPVAQAAVRESVEAALEHARGCSFDRPLIVQAPHGPASQLRGKLGRRRDKSNHAPKPVDLTGRIGGFMHFAKANYFVLQPTDDPGVRVDFLNEQLRAESEPGSLTTLSLVELARMNACGTSCTIRIHQTQDAQGRAVYTFVRMLPPPDNSPPAESSIMANANTATNS